MTLHDPHDGEQRYESDGLDFLAPLDHVEDDGDSMELPAFPTASDPDDEPVPTGEAFGAPFPGTATEGDPGVGDHTNEIFDLASTASTSENQVPMTVVTNPPETVAVTAYPTGNVARIELSHKVTAMTEAELAEEIVVVADTATKKASAWCTAASWTPWSSMVYPEQMRRNSQPRTCPSPLRNKRSKPNWPSSLATLSKAVDHSDVDAFSMPPPSCAQTSKPPTTPAAPALRQAP